MAASASGARQYSQAPVYVDDAPRFQYRGLLVDTARHFLPVPHLLHVIDSLAYSKLNLLHWHIVDSQSFPCGSDVYPQLAEKGVRARGAAADLTMQSLLLPPLSASGMGPRGDLFYGRPRERRRVRQGARRARPPRVGRARTRRLGLGHPSDHGLVRAPPAVGPNSCHPCPSRWNSPESTPDPSQNL